MRDRCRQMDCLKCKNSCFVKSQLKRFYKIDIIDGESIYINHYCCNKCIKDIESDESFYKLSEIFITENYNEFLKNGINGIDIKKYYQKLHESSIKKYEKMIFEVLHEIYEYENNPSSFILK